MSATFCLLLLLPAGDAPAGEIAYMRGGKVWLANADGSGRPREVGQEERYQADRPLSWSPDGKTLLFWNHSEIGWNIWATHCDGQPPRNLTNAKSGGCRVPAWSPDGKQIALMRDDPPGLYVMQSDGSRQQKLSVRSNRDVQPSWSPDGKRLVFADLREDGGRIDEAVYLVNADGSGERLLVADATSPRWSPQDDKIALIWRRSGQAKLAIVSAGGGEPRVLTDQSGEESEPRWSPDGASLSFVRQTAKLELCAARIDDGPPRVLSAVEGNLFQGHSWSPDGRWIVFQSGDRSQESVFVSDARGGTPKKLSAGVLPAWRPQQKAATAP